MTRRLAHEPFGLAADDAAGHDPPLPVHRLRARVAPGHQRRRPSRGRSCRVAALRWALEGDRVSAPDRRPGRRRRSAVAWNTANDAVLAEGKRVLIDDPARFDGVRVIGVDEHVWRHTRRGDKYVTVIIDLTPIRDGTGPARLLDMVEGRSKQAFKTWLADASRGLARRGRGRRDGRVHRVQDRHHRGTARRGRGDGPLPRRPPGRRRPRPVPAPRPAGHPRPPRPHRRPALRRPADPAHRRRPAHRQAERPADRPVRRRASTSRSKRPGASTSG